jgi:molybdopterin synthase sulfur carrier subunit
MIRVLLFASLREIVGAGELSVPAPASGSASLTAGQVFEGLATQARDLERYRLRVGIAVNQKLATRDTPVAEGDEVAFYPPVSGGAQ